MCIEYDPNVIYNLIIRHGYNINLVPYRDLLFLVEKINDRINKNKKHYISIPIKIHIYLSNNGFVESMKKSKDYFHIWKLFHKNDIRIKVSGPHQSDCYQFIEYLNILGIDAIYQHLY
tara:strand:- start:238 stop:591 length:354 start_codon:yes stop_codon:yes gene_type:complete